MTGGFQVLFKLSEICIFFLNDINLIKWYTCVKKHATCIIWAPNFSFSLCYSIEEMKQINERYVHALIYSLSFIQYPKIHSVHLFYCVLSIFLVCFPARPKDFINTFIKIIACFTEIIHKIDDYFKHHHNQELLKHGLYVLK